MPTYTYTADDARELPDVPTFVEHGDTVTLPDGFFVDADQALAMGFTLTTASTPPVPPVEPVTSVSDTTPSAPTA